jgi:hypothetical protein
VRAGAPLLHADVDFDRLASCTALSIYGSECASLLSSPLTTPAPATSLSASIPTSELAPAEDRFGDCTSHPRADSVSGVSPAFPWELTPRQSIERECALRGSADVVRGCVAILESGGADADDMLIVALAGPAAHRVLSGDSRADPLLWKRVWATRGLLWAWEPSAAPAIRSALADESWRVREMAAKVVRRQLIGDLLAEVAELREDPQSRVRAAASSAVETLVNAGA